MPFHLAGQINTPITFNEQSITQDFEMFSGNSETLNIFITDGNDNVVNTTGYILTWFLSRSPQGTPVVQKDNASIGGVTNGGTTGEFIVSITPTDSATLSGAYYHQANLTDTSGNVSTVLFGKVSVI